jgi:hypothetical protein
MQVQAWVPGDGDELVPRIHRAIAAFVEEAGIARAWVLVELAEGTRLPLEALLAEPGGGFVTLVPHREDDEEPERVIVPVASIRRIELARAEAQRERLGFAVRDA